MTNEHNTLLTPKERQRIINKVLNEYFRESTGRNRVPSDYLLMFTEGGEADAIAYAIATKQQEKTRRIFLRNKNEKHYCKAHKDKHLTVINKVIQKQQPSSGRKEGKDDQANRS